HVVLPRLALFICHSCSFFDLGRGEHRGCQTVLAGFSVEDALASSEVLGTLALTLLTGPGRVEPGGGQFFGRGQLSAYDFGRALSSLARGAGCVDLNNRCGQRVESGFDT